MRFDKNGVEILEFADVPNSGATKADPNAKSGNPHHDTRSGKFGGGGGEKKKASDAPPNTDPLAYARMLDAVREAARLYDTPDADVIKEFLANRASNPEAVDLNGFLVAVREQQKNDIVDIINAKLQSAEAGVNIAAPDGFLKNLISGLDEAGVAEVIKRLEGRGHDTAKLKRFFEIPEETDGADS